MDPTLKMSLVFIAILTCHLISTSTAIKIKITTKRYKGVVPTSFDVTCTLDPEKSDYYRAKRIIAIKVSRRGERPLAVLQQNSKILYDRLLAPNIEAKGHIVDQDPTKSNLTVTVNNAMKEDSGVYNCSLLYFDRWGYMQREKASTNFSIEDNNVHDVTRYFVGELEMLKNQLAELKNKTTLQLQVEKVETELQHQANDAETARKQYEKEIDTLKTKIKTLETQTTNHITKANLQSGFMASLKESDKLLHQETIKFREVQLNIGNNFDAETSLYTAPYDGLYNFFVTAVIVTRKFCLLDIRVNGRTVSRLVARDADNDHQSSVSALLSLKAGDTVDVFGFETSGRHPLFAYGYAHTYFSGFLVKAT